MLMNPIMDSASYVDPPVTSPYNVTVTPALIASKLPQDIPFPIAPVVLEPGLNTAASVNETRSFRLEKELMLR